MRILFTRLHAIIYTGSLSLLFSLPSYGQLDVSDSSPSVCINTSDSVVILLMNPDDSSDTVALDVEDLDTLLTLTFGNDSLISGEMTEVVVTGINKLKSSSTFYLVSNNSSNSDSTLITIDIQNIPTPSILNFPENERNEISLTSVFTWVEEGHDNYIYQLATDSQFNNLVRSDTLNISFIENVVLEASTQYFWRVKGINKCGEGEFSVPFTFNTIALFCFNSSGTEIPLPGGDTTSFITIDIAPQIEGIISSLKINLRGNFDSLQNLNMRLVAPDGTSAVLFQNICAEADTFDVLLSDDPGLSVLTCPGKGMESYNAPSPLSVFSGLSSTGVWSISIEMNGGGNGGIIDFINLEMCVKDNGQELLDITTESVIICPNETFMIRGLLGKRFMDTVNISIEAKDYFISTTENPLVDKDTLVIDFSIDQENFVSESSSMTIFIDDGMTVDSHVVAVTILENPGMAMLISPDDMIEMNSLSPTFLWSSSVATDNYELIISIDENIEDIYYRMSIADTTFTLSDTLLPETKYYWKISSLGGCGSQDSDTRSFTTESSTSVADIDKENITIYPNPAFEFIYIKNHSGQKIQSITIFDLKGRIIKEVSGYSGQIDISNIDVGFYLIGIKTGDSYINQKLLKIR